MNLVASGVSGHSVDMALCPLAAQELGAERGAAERCLVTMGPLRWVLLFCIILKKTG